MITPYIDNINIEDFLVFKKNPTPGYLYGSKNIGDILLFIKNPTPGYIYGIKYIDIISDEYKKNYTYNTNSVSIFKFKLIRRSVI